MLLIGEKQSSALFDQQDLELFGVLAPQLSAALQKSQLYSEVQDYSANLQKKVEQAIGGIRG